MINSNEAVMPSLKGNLVNVIPTKDNVEYDRVYCYTDRNLVNKFGTYEANKPLNIRHIMEIRDEFDNGQYRGKYVAPITVDINNLKIVDGQHRRAAFVESDSNEAYLQVIFEDLPTNESDAMDVVIAINSSTDNWGINAYEKHLKADDKKSIFNAEEFGKSHKLTQKVNRRGEVVGYFPRYVYAIVLGRNATMEANNGNIYVSKKELEFGEKMYDELEKLVDALGYEIDNWFESFAAAWYNIRLNGKNDSEVVDKLGFDTICKYISDYFKDYPLVGRKTKWEERFRDAIWQIKCAILGKE